MSCTHNQFKANVSVAKLESDSESKQVSGYAAELRISCAECGMPFEFIGMQAGISTRNPMTSLDRTELRAPIRPTSNPVETVKSLLNEPRY